ncbi:MAG: HD domain-containing protein [Candidatus Shapirobacteria bacterium]|nr:HD domain-containing protein [Candidatus Shapirobacteria bacterium]MDD5073988.1 HD domain-containing protein [Candidatus Shapirobacteria bacterium]MDD5481611.1 HD domain-containing protein [Candidatus Shapirobacteria bacterium]
MKKAIITKDLYQKLPPESVSILKKIYRAGFDIFLVGGAVRDLLLGLPIGDLDFATLAPPKKIQELFPNSFYDNAYGTVKIPQQKRQIEITTFRSESGYQDHRHPDKVSWGKTIEEDLSRRDFTINALALGVRAKEKIFQPKLVDKFSGQKDLEKKLIRAVGNPEERFAEDALRLLRAIRLSAQLNFSIENKTLSAIKKQALLIENVSWERIREELFKILLTDQIELAFETLRTTGLINHLLPELIKGYQMAQKGHHLWGVWKHSLLSAQYCPKLNPVVRLAALIHDIGKPIVVKDENGQRTFHNHEVVSASLARQIGQRLKLSKKDLNRLVKLVRHHQFSVSEEQTDKAIKRFIRRVGPENIPDMLALRTGDRLGSGAKETSWRTELFKKRLIEVQREPFSIKDLKINGRDVMKTLNIPPGPKVGQILASLFDQVDNKQLANDRKILLAKLKEQSGSKSKN